MRALTAGGANVVTKAKAKCTVFSARLNLNDRKTLARLVDPAFAAAVKALPTTFSSATAPALLAFVQRYGTHHVKEAWLGGSATQTTGFSQSDWAALVRWGAGAP